MFDVQKDLDKAIQKVTIQIGDLLGKPKEDVFVTFSEPDTFATLKMNSVDKTKPEALVRYFDEIFDSVLVDHNFQNGDVKASVSEVHKVLFKKFNIVESIVTQYLKEVFLSPQSKTSEK